MRFNELQLYIAVHETYDTLRSPRSDKWITEDADALCRAIGEHLPYGHPYQMAQTIEAWTCYGKSGKAGDLKKLELTVLVARLHGAKCFWAGRGLGECSQEATLDRLVPGSWDPPGEYTLENCVIACTLHNSARGNLSVEEYLRKAEL